MPNDYAIDISELFFSWDGHVPLLEIESLQICKGRRVFIEGPSGSGKSTLLSLTAGVVLPQKGIVKANGELVSGLRGADRDRFRADHVGFIFQLFNLIPYLSVVENVTLPCRFSMRRRNRASNHAYGCEQEAQRLLEKLGMGSTSLINKPATELSVGQQQRVAAARALIGRPEIIIADEPTSALDNAHRESFIQLLFQECDRQEATLIFVSHDITLAEFFDQTIRLADINRIQQP